MLRRSRCIQIFILKILMQLRNLYDSEHSLRQRGKLRLGGSIGCKDTNSEWNLIGLPNGNIIGLTVLCRKHGRVQPSTNPGVQACYAIVSTEHRKILLHCSSDSGNAALLVFRGKT